MIPVDISVKTEAIHLQNVVRRTYQRPLSTNFFDPPHEKLPEAPRLFDLAKDRFDNSLARCVHCGARFCLKLACHFIHMGRSLRKRSTLAGSRFFPVLLSPGRDEDINGFLLE